MQPQAILGFWFEELIAKQHFAKDAALEAAARCELFAWRATAQGRLAEIIVLDQFSRNVYRDTPRAFAQDAGSGAYAGACAVFAAGPGKQREL